MKRKKRGVWISRPFGKFADELASDSSDSDYKPDDETVSSEATKRKRKAAKMDFSDDDRVSGRSSAISKYHGAMQGHSRTSTKDEDMLKVLQPDVPSTLKQSGWNSIPTEIIVKIFGFLTSDLNGMHDLVKSGMACRQWYYGSKHPSLWKNVDLSFMSNSAKANDKTIIKLMKDQGENIETLVLSNWKKLTDKGIMAIATMCPNIESLGLSGCEKSVKNSKGIDAIISIINNGQLKNVDFSWLKLPNSNKMIQSLMEKCGRILRSINLCGCPVRVNTLNSIMDSCPNLRILDISNTWIYTINIEKLQTSCPNLQELYIAKSNLTMRSSGQKDDSPCFQDLVALSLQCDSLTDDLLTQAVKNSHQLSLLDLRTCKFISMHALMSVVASDVERLFLSRACASFSLDQILEKWGDTLQELDLSWIAPGTNSHGLDNESLGKIVKTGVQFKKLKKLDLAGSAVYDEGIRHILRMFPNLESLNLTSCKGVARGLKHEYDKNGLKELRKKMKTLAQRS